MCRDCGAPITRHSKTGRCAPCSDAAKRKPMPPAPDAAMQADIARRREKSSAATLQARYDESLRTIERLTRELEASVRLAEPVETVTITPRAPSKTGEATAVWVASDWHVEEPVGPEIGSLNRYSLAIAEARATDFFRHGLRLTQLLRQDIQIDTIVLALLGDFISGHIHDELVETSGLSPMHAIAFAQRLLVSGIEFLLRESTYQIVLPCHSGNHGRTTKKTQFVVENGHSLEYLMYLHLAAYFRTEPRVTFVIPDGPHSYLTVYDQTIRFQHGHMVKYGGGVGGIYIPVNKAIAQWNKGRHADLDVFGHFHQLRDGGNFICNGSLIGYNAFALSIKADYEKPKQALFLLDKRRGRTCLWPILFDK